MAAASADLAPARTAPDDDCLWLYSSGSTGAPKGVVHAHRDSVFTSQYFGVETLGIGEDDVVFSAPRLFFSYGFGNAMTFPLWTGATAVLSDNVPTPESTFDVIERFRPTVFFGVPTLYARQLAALEAHAPDLASIRFAVSAGEPLPAEIFRGFRDKAGITILDGIGSTEVHHIFISNTLEDARPGSTGRAVTGYQVKIVGEDGAPVAAGEIGSLMVKGESVARYYWNNPQKTAETMIGDWIHTGDTYYQDGDGYFIYCGRNDDMLKVGGIWCSPAEIEARLVEHPAVLEAAVVGRADGEGLIKPAAFVVLQEAEEKGDALVDELVAHCKDGLARYKYPRWISFLDDLPKTATGKIQRFRLRQ
jgi:benzoate-CoA ligase family protein